MFEAFRKFCVYHVYHLLFFLLQLQHVDAVIFRFKSMPFVYFWMVVCFFVFYLRLLLYQNMFILLPKPLLNLSNVSRYFSINVISMVQKAR